ncbi:hypothetical protein [Polymorphospora rubra]|uniref:hypothetical protein n=1 Tax=Polymorphospora rubra TaxID=338584 RepID=UPI002484BC75|nr:hypothetical protein [Polymorphospora rubra]
MGDHVWIGGGVTIIHGVAIGANTIIGSGGVVTRPIPANVVAVGPPARVLREITDADKTGYRL